MCIGDNHGNVLEYHFLLMTIMTLDLYILKTLNYL